MRIYISHSSAFDFKNKLYDPVKNSVLMNGNEILFPHESKIKNTKDFIASCDVVIAEVSLQSTGQGIELGWADAFGIPILCVYEKGSTITTSLNFISNDITEYENANDLICKLIEKLG